MKAELIITGWAVLGTVFVWALFCALIVVGIEYRDKKTWHGWMASFRTNNLPQTTCSYWFEMFISPSVMILVWMMFLIVVALMLCLAAMRFISHWIIAPVFLGRYVLIKYRKGYSIFCDEDLGMKENILRYIKKGLFACPDEGYSAEGVIPYTRIKPFIWLIIGGLLYDSYQHMDEIAKVVMVNTNSAAASVFTMNAVVQVLGYIAGTILVLMIAGLITKHRARISEAWRTMHGKICRKIPDKNEVINSEQVGV